MIHTYQAQRSKMDGGLAETRLSTALAILDGRLRRLRVETMELSTSHVEGAKAQILDQLTQIEACMADLELHTREINASWMRMRSILKVVFIVLFAIPVKVIYELLMDFALR